jgi:hypothetical protein
MNDTLRDKLSEAWSMRFGRLNLWEIANSEP